MTNRIEAKATRTGISLTVVGAWATGTFLLSLLIVIIMFYEQIAGAIVWIIAAITGAGVFTVGCAGLWLAGRGAREVVGAVADYQDRQAKRLTDYVVKSNRTERLYIADKGQLKLVADAWQPGNVIDGQAKTLPDEQPAPPLLDVITPEKCVGFFGRRGSGKTTSAQHWLAAQPGRKIVIDIKPRGENVWPAGCEVYGQNDDIAGVLRGVEIAEAEFKRRKKQDFQRHPPMLLFVDELFYLVKIRDLDIMSSVWTIISVGRSYNIHAGFTAAGKEVELLDAKGMGSLRQNLAMAFLKKFGSEYRATVDLGDGEFAVQPTGPYFATALPAPQTEADRIRGAFAPDKSLSDMCREVWGESRRGGYYMSRIKETMTNEGWLYENEKWIKVSNFPP